MEVKILYKDGEQEKIEHVLAIGYNYNGVGDIQIHHGQYHTNEKVLLTKDIERLSVL